jgi:hypothetical protein
LDGFEDISVSVRVDSIFKPGWNQRGGALMDGATGRPTDQE